MAVDLTLAAKRHYRSILSEGKSEKTASIYDQAATSLGRWLEANGKSLDVALISRDDVEDWLADLRASRSESTVETYFRGARALFKWLVEDEELERSPMAKLKAPKVGERLTQPMTDEELSAFVDSIPAKGRFYDVRDYALVRLLMETGCRASEVANLTLADLDLTEDVAHVIGKGNRERQVAFGPKAAKALRAYVRARSTHHLADQTDRLWLGKEKPLSAGGLGQMIRNRGRAIGMEVHPHLFRHTFADRWLEAGGSQQALQDAAGWKSAAMVARYANGRRQARAMTESRRLDLFRSV